jgi:hypothetical protein
LWLRRCGLLKVVNRRGLVIVGCDRRWCKMVDRSVGLMCKSSWWWVCRCDCLRRRWRRGATAEDRRWTVFFCNQNSTLFFLDQSRVKHKPVDHLIVRTIKSHALMRNNK